jgi:hypothetical protein
MTQNNMGEKKATCIRKVALEVCEATKGSEGEAKDTWWWKEEAQSAIKEKKNVVDDYTMRGVSTT